MLTGPQRDGAAFLSSRPVAMLADAPGVGKSAQIARALDLIGAESALAIAPNQTLCVNLAREIEKWSLLGHETHVLRSGKDELPERGVILTTYALASRPEVARRLVKRKYDALICDEAHAMKSPSAARTKAILSKAGLARNARHLWLATGTPAPNNAGELFVFARVAGAWPGSYNQFIEKYCVLREGAFGISIAGSKNQAELKALLAPYYLRRTAVEGRPALTVSHMAVPPSRAVDPYESLSDEDRAIVQAAIESRDWKLADIPSIATVRRAVGLAKADGVAELAAAELEGGYRKTLIFCQHTAVIDRIAAALAPFGAEIIDGRTSQKKRVAIVDAFQGDGGPRVIVAQMQAASEGLTLTKANRVIITEPAWTPHVNEQAICRAWRRGQPEHVHASFIGLAGSVDDRISAALNRKSEEIALLV